MTDIPAHGCFGEKRPELLGRRSPIRDSRHSGFRSSPIDGEGREPAPAPGRQRQSKLSSLYERRCLAHMNPMSRPYKARFSVAPMMDWTDRRCRAFHRVLTRRARLYTEMVTADAVVFGPRERLIGFDPSEHAVALQLGGAAPSRLAEAARIGAEFGYDEINLNCGCPSDRVQSGRFGACLMREPSARRRMRGGDGRGRRHSGDGQVPHRRRRAGAARGPVRLRGSGEGGGRGGAYRPRAQSLARGPEPQGQQVDPAARLRPRPCAQARASGLADHPQRRPRRPRRGARAFRAMSTESCSAARPIRIRSS